MTESMSNTGSEPSGAGRNTHLAKLIVPAALTVYFVGVTLVATSSRYALADLAAITAIYLLLALQLHYGTQYLRFLGLAPELWAALFVGAVLAWHLREETRAAGTGATLWSFQGMAPFLATVLAFAAVWFFLARIPAKPAGVGRPFFLWLGSTIALVIVLATGYMGSNTLRWHLLRHNKLLGTPAFHLLSPEIQSLEVEAWTSNMGPTPLDYEPWPILNPQRGEEAKTGEAAAASGSGTEGAEVGVQPNIIFVMLDTLRADSLAAFGGDPSLMPNLNRLAEDSFVFTDVMANASWTRPSVAAYFTGLLPEEHGAVGWNFRLVPERVTVAEVLAGFGFDNAGFVANLRAVAPEAGFDQGFDSYTILRDPDLPHARAAQVTDEVIAWFEARKQGALAGAPASSPASEGSRQQPEDATEDPEVPLPPAFVYAHYMDPHAPYLAEGEAFYQYGTPASNVEAKRQYNLELAYMDEHLQRLFDYVEQQVEGETVFLIASDHGEEFGEHGERGHGHSLFSELIGVPVMIHGLGGQTGTSAAKLEGRDFFEVLVRVPEAEPLDLTAWAESRSRDSRYSAVSTQKDPGPSSFVHALLRPYRDRVFMRLIEVGNDRLIWSAYGPTYQLYDLEADPGQLDNRARGNRELIAALAAAMDAAPRWWAQLVPIVLTDDALRDLRALGYIQ
jgi:arylsulfatase A-like enzyme